MTALQLDLRALVKVSLEWKQSKVCEKIQKYGIRIEGHCE